MPRRRTSPIWSVSLREFRRIIDSSHTIGEVLSHFGLVNKGSNHLTLKRRCAEDSVDLSALMERSKAVRAKNTALSNRFPLDEILVENSQFNRGHIKRRLIKEGLLTEICAKCGIGPLWQHERLSLVLDHINGVPNDNRLENLRLLCPNCNSQTPTFAGRQKRNNRQMTQSRVLELVAET